MKKSECLEYLQTVNSCYAMGLLSCYLISTIENAEIPSILTSLNIQFPSKKSSFDISLLKYHLNHEQDRIQLVSEFYKSIIRTFIHNTYELVLAYAIASGQDQIIYDSELMIFTRLLRNNVGHDHKFRFKSEKDIQRLQKKPVKWRDKEITLAMEGKKIPMDMIDAESVNFLFEDIVNFVQTDMK